MSNKVDNKTKNKKVERLPLGHSFYVPIQHPPGINPFFERCVEYAMNVVKRDLKNMVLHEALKQVYSVKDPKKFLEKMETSNFEWPLKHLRQHIEFELLQMISKRLEQYPLHEELDAEKADEV